MATQSTQTTLDPTDPRLRADIEQQQWIATAAYYKAAARGFAAGRELEDWLEAEREFGSQFQSA